MLHQRTSACKARRGAVKLHSSNGAPEANLVSDSIALSQTLLALNNKMSAHNFVGHDYERAYDGEQLSSELK